jgi:hypothetical protein
MATVNLIVFRDTAREISRKALVDDMESAVSGARGGDPRCVLDALILAGQLESALWDSASPCAANSSALTDRIAQCFVNGSWREFGPKATTISELMMSLPDAIRVAEPEGFAYYALHPGDFADEALSFAQRNPTALIGIRSIGTTLSAVAMAQLHKAMTPASRITVRPTGHPYNRRNSFTPWQAEWVDQNNAQAATFLVLDEGPGLSGSSFLAVAESLVDCGVNPDRIVMVGTRECDPAQLCTRDAVHRWNRFRWKKVGSRVYARFSDSIFVGAGVWREKFLAPKVEWPASWTEMERLRFLTPARKYIAKFEGFGQTGKNAFVGAETLHRAGFGPKVESVGDGMHRYGFISGQPLSALDVTPDVLDRIARYCAFRDSDFATSQFECSQIREMVEFNFLQGTGAAIHLPADCYDGHKSTLVDGRMQPHEWIRALSGEILKVDAVQHGDDHFLPGRTDIAWDLAGTIVEWNLNDDGANYLQKKFSLWSGRSVADRLPYFVLAYSTFRYAYCKMASEACQNAAERTRLIRSSDFYRGKMIACSASMLTA